MKPEILRFAHVELSDFDVQLIDHLNLQVFEGEIHGILGLSGSANDALIRLLSGRNLPTRGQIFFEDAPVKLQNSKKALEMGIYCIPTDVSVMKNLTVSENMMILHNSFDKKILFKNGLVLRKIQVLLREFSLDLLAESAVGTLSDYQIILLELVKAVSIGAKLIVANWITKSFSENQALEFKKILKVVQSRGITVLLLMNNISKAMRYCDRITAVFHGIAVKTLTRDQFSKSQLLSCLSGGRSETPGIQKSSVKNQRLLTVEGMRISGFPDLSVSFSLNRGEILGLIDYEGNLSFEILNALYGLKPHTEYMFQLGETSVKISSPAQAFQSGFVMLRNLSKHSGLMKKLDVLENVYLPAMKKSSFPLGVLRKKFLKIEAQRALEKNDINLNDRSFSLKEQGIPILLSRVDLYYSNILLLRDSTEGMNYSDTQKVYNYLKKYISSNRSVILASSDISEIYSVCNRFYEISDGTLKERIIP